MDEFIELALEKLAMLDDQQWFTYQHGLAAQLKEKDASLRTKSQRFWTSITNQDFEFNRKAVLLEAMESITQHDVTGFIEQHLKQQMGAYKHRLTLVSNEANTIDQYWTDRNALVIEDSKVFAKKLSKKILILPIQ